jgi:hypothetical protein
MARPEGQHATGARLRKEFDDYYDPAMSAALIMLESASERSGASVRRLLETFVLIALAVVSWFVVGAIWRWKSVPNVATAY